MAESTLSLALTDLQTEVCDFMGWGRDITATTTDQQNRANRDIASGLRRFYFTMPPHDWSFLRPLATFTLLKNVATIEMPDDFGGVDGSARINVSDTAQSVYAPIDFDNPGRIQQFYSEYPSLTGRPRAGSIRPRKGTSPAQGQKFELFMWPLPDANYTLTFPYNVLPDYLNNTLQPFPYGGGEHAETILEACLSVAEERRDDLPEGIGPHSIAFAKRLAASMAMDSRKKPTRLGYNRDMSDDVDVLVVPLRGLNPAAVTVNGVSYS